jgi:hypothetical protein
MKEDPKRLGHVQVRATRPFDSTVEPCAYENAAAVGDLPPLSACQPVFIDYGLRRFKLAIQLPEGQVAAPQRLRQALASLSDAKTGLVELVEDPRQAEWLIRVDQGKVQLLEASGNRVPFALPGLDSTDLGDALRQSLERVHRARNLIALATQFETNQYRDSPPVDVVVELLRHKDKSAPGEPLPRPPAEWVFRPKDLISFRVRNKSPSLQIDITLLYVGTDFQISPYYPHKNEWGKSLKPGEALSILPPGMIGGEPPFGPECLVVIAAPVQIPPVEFAALAQDGLTLARSADRNQSLRSPLGELLESAMFRTGSRSGLERSVAEQYGMRVLNWRTESGTAQKH